MDYVEITLAKLLSGVRGHDKARFVKGPAFASHPSPTINVTSAECGPSGSQLPITHTQDGKDLFPELDWTPVPSAAEYLLVCEDVDAPMPVPITHGIMYCIPAEVTGVRDELVDPVEGARKKLLGNSNKCKGGWLAGANIRGAAYGGPRALKGHGPHKYYYMVVALSEKLDPKRMSPIAKKTELAKEIEGKVLAWGEWMGVSERKWK